MSAHFFTFYTNSQCFLTILIKKLSRAPESPFSNFEYGSDYAVVTVGHYYKTAVALTEFWTVCFASIYHTRGPIKILTKLIFFFKVIYKTSLAFKVLTKPIVRPQSRCDFEIYGTSAAPLLIILETTLKLS